LLMKKKMEFFISVVPEDQIEFRMRIISRIWHCSRCCVANELERFFHTV
jgi:hypothetical protein